MARADGSGQVRVTNLNGPSIDHLQWSPDGRWLAFDSGLYGRSGIVALECNSAGTHCGGPKRLTSDHAAEAIPGWSADGKFLYFASDRTGRWEVWKQPAFGGRAIQVTRKGGYTARESVDGRWLYFSKLGHDSIWRMHVQQSGRQTDSGEALVIGSPYRVQPERWTVTANEIVFINRSANGGSAEIRAYDFAKNQTRLILTLPEFFSDRNDMGVSVSPDSRWVLYSQLDRSGSNVMVADNIR